jgi:hypothetical protein
MTNIYLEKISGLFGNILRAGGSIVKDVGKDIGHSVHLATGGGFRDAAYASGVKDMDELRHVHDVKSYRDATEGMPSKTWNKVDNGKFKMTPGPHLSPTPEQAKKLQDLTTGKTKGIIKTVGYGTAVVYGGNKILNKIKENNENKEYYQ